MDGHKVQVLFKITVDKTQILETRKKVSRTKWEKYAIKYLRVLQCP